MNSNRGIFGAVALALFLFALLVPMLSTNAAPAAAPTPVVFVNNGSRAVDQRLVPFFNGTPIAALTPVTQCYDLRGYSVIDLQWTSSQNTTTTLSLSHGIDADHLSPGQTLINASQTPVATPVLQQYPLYGVVQCVTLSSVSATPQAVWVKGLAK